MISLLFGYNDEYEFHGPLEIVLGYVDFFELESKVVYVCKNFYLAGKCSYLNRKIGYWDIHKILSDNYRMRKNVGLDVVVSLDKYFVKIYENKCFRFDNSLFLLISKNGLTKIMKVLLNENKMIDPTYNNNDAIRGACQDNNEKVIKLLLNDKRVSLHYDRYVYYSLITAACSNGFEEIFKLVLNNRRFNPQDCDDEPIKLAIKNGHKSIVELLVNDKRINPCYNNNYAIRWASYKGYHKLVKTLLSDYRVNPSDLNNDAIRHANLLHNKSIVRLLLHNKQVSEKIGLLKTISGLLFGKI